MNEPAIRTEEQSISLFPDRETLVCRGWVLKRMEGRTAGAVWAVGFSQSLSLPLLSEKSGGEIFRKRGIENGFTE